MSHLWINKWPVVLWVTIRVKRVTRVFSIELRVIKVIIELRNQEKLSIESWITIRGIKAEILVKMRVIAIIVH